MRNYEIMFIVKSTIDAESQKTIIDNMKHIITDSKGKITEEKDMGEKKLAYPIEKEISGHYYLLEVTCDPEATAEFNRKALIDENVLRHLIIRLDEE